MLNTTKILITLSLLPSITNINNFKIEKSVSTLKPLKCSTKEISSSEFNELLYSGLYDIDPYQCCEKKGVKYTIYILNDSNEQLISYYQTDLKFYHVQYKDSISVTISEIKSDSFTASMGFGISCEVEGNGGEVVKTFTASTSESISFSSTVRPVESSYATGTYNLYIADIRTNALIKTSETKDGKTTVKYVKVKYFPIGVGAELATYRPSLTYIPYCG